MVEPAARGGDLLGGFDELTCGLRSYPVDGIEAGDAGSTHRPNGPIAGAFDQADPRSTVGRRLEALDRHSPELVLDGALDDDSMGASSLILRRSSLIEERRNLGRQPLGGASDAQPV